MKSILDINYYSSPLPLSLNCFQSPFYVKIKQQLDPSEEPYECFLQDPSFFIEVHEDSQMVTDLVYFDNWDYDKIFHVENFASKGNKLLSKFLEELEKGYVVPFKTHGKRVPYLRDYISYDYEYDEIKEYEKTEEHVFMALKFENNKLYYLDHPVMFHADHFKPYHESNHIGSIDIDDLKYAFECYLKFMVITINQEEYDQCLGGGSIKPLMRYIVKNNKIGPFLKNGCSYHHNLNALKKLHELSCHDKVSLAAIPGEYEFNLCKLFEWKFDMLKGKRIILLESIKKHKSDFHNSDSLIVTFEDVINAWMLIINKLRRMIYVNKYTELSSLKLLLENLIMQEERLHAEMGLVVDTVRTKIT